MSTQVLIDDIAIEDILTLQFEDTNTHNHANIESSFSPKKTLIYLPALSSISTP